MIVFPTPAAQADFSLFRVPGDKNATHKIHDSEFNDPAGRIGMPHLCQPCVCTVCMVERPKISLLGRVPAHRDQP